MAGRDKAVGETVKELDKLITFHRAGLEQYRQFIAPSAQYLEEQTIKALEKLREIEES